MGINEFNQAIPLIYMIAKFESNIGVETLRGKFLEWKNAKPEILCQIVLRFTIGPLKN